MSFKNKVLDMSNEQLLAEELRNVLSLLWFIRSQQDASGVFELQILAAIERRYADGTDLLKKLGHSQP